jgi:crotonobetainyl-CoA:carnitine CoA-transferase CaiB-like acyl-CoA transferase
MGAEVIKVERPGAGDPLRAMPPFKDGIPNPETGALHLHLSMAKKSITLDVSSPTGRGLFLRLLETADVLVESAGPKAMAHLGLPYEELHARHRQLILTSVTYFGSEGPYADYKMDELTAYSMGGYTYLTGLPGREPIKAGGYQAHYQGGLHAAAGTMAALCQRDLTGEGDHVDASIVEAICFAHAGMSAYLNSDVVFRRVGARLLSEAPRAMYPSTILPCKDGFIHAHYAPADPAIMGVLTETPRLSDPDLWETPRAFADEIDELLSAWLARYDKYEAVSRAQELRHPFTEVLDPSDLFRDAQFQERGFFQELEHPVAGKVAHLGPPFRMSESGWHTDRAPLLAEHNREVYVERLGLTLEELAMLSGAGVV